MRLFLISFILLLAMTAPGTSVQATLLKAPPGEAVNLVGRWRVKFTLMGGNEKNLVFEARLKGEGSFMLLDTGLDDKPVVAPQAAVWSLTKNNASISGEVELPIGTCCREMGTLIFKARVNSGNSISGCCQDRRASRSASEPGRPNIRSNTTRGLVSIGNGVVGDFHEMVFMYAQL